LSARSAIVFGRQRSLNAKLTSRSRTRSVTATNLAQRSRHQEIPLDVRSFFNGVHPTMHTRSLLAVLATTFLLAGCRATDSVTPPTSAGPMLVAKLAGDGQAAPVTHQLPSPLIARAYIDTTHGARTVRLALVPLPRADGVADTTAEFQLGIPLKNRAISFVVPDPTCGAPFSNTEVTDSLGVVRQLWTGGTKANASCTMEARAVDQTTGQPITYATFTASFNPGPITFAILWWQAPELQHLITGDTVHLRTYINSARDAYNNLSTNYAVRYMRKGYDDILSDTAAIAGDAVVVRRTDASIVVWLDSTQVGYLAIQVRNPQ
jgi:hypothetical protein